MTNSTAVTEILEYLADHSGDTTSMNEVLEELDNLLEDNNSFKFEFGGREYLLISEDIIDEVWTESLITQIKETYDLENIPNFVSIDWEKTAENYKVYGAGHHFSSYDGSEQFIGNWYIFCVN